jgi:hypothetical protein
MNISEEITDYVKTHPGATSDEIFDAMPHGTKWGTVSNTLSRLKKRGVLENRGGTVNRFSPALWHCAKMPANSYAQELAHEIFEEMMRMHRSVREAFLAQKLTELFEDQ